MGVSYTGVDERHLSEEKPLTVREICTLLGVSQSYVLRLMKQAGLSKGKDERGEPIRHPIRAYLILAKRFRTTWEQRMRDRAWVDEELYALHTRVSLLEAELAGMRRALAPTMLPPPGPAPSPTELRCLDGFSTHRRARKQ